MASGFALVADGATFFASGKRRGSENAPAYVTKFEGTISRARKNEPRLHHPKSRVRSVIRQNERPMQRLQSSPETVLEKRVTTAPTVCENATLLVGAEAPQTRQPNAQPPSGGVAPASRGGVPPPCTMSQ